jgi:carboxyl-terminal processing protease
MPFKKHNYPISDNYFIFVAMNYNKNSKLQAWLPLLLSISVIIGMLIGFSIRGAMPGKKFFSLDKAHTLEEVLSLVENKYVDDVQLGALNDTAIEALLSKLDPHSVYIPAAELQSVNDDIAGVFFGIGVEFDIIKDTIHVINLVPNGPSDKAGLITGDKFLVINDTVVAGKRITAEKIRSLLRGDLNTNVIITILRGVQQQKFTITRGMIPVSSVDAAYIIQKGIGYIRLNKFSQVTYREFMQAMEKLKKQGLQKLILDLRSNGGGVLDEATAIADEFLSGDKLITYTEGKHFPKKEYRCKKEGVFETGTLFVLSDEGTASASEILIGALQDWDRATVVGRRSFGKGLVQEQYDLNDGSALRLTIARYYTPIGRSIQRPYNNGDKAYYEEIANRFHDGEVVTIDSIKNDTSKIFKTPKGKVLYGSGGISPDVFVGLDTTIDNRQLSKITMSGIVGDFAYTYYLKNKKNLLAYKSIADYSANFLLNEVDWLGFSQMATKDSINLNSIAIMQKEIVKLRVKAAIARHIWRNEGFFEIINKQDNTINKALKMLSK